MADLGKAYVQIIPKAQGISEKIKGAVGPGAKQAGQSAGGNFVGSLKKVIAGAAIGAVVVKGFKAALDAGGKLQQSYGGLDTLYGDAADAAKKYAAEAAKAGISANDYAEQAVSFGASLKAAFGGDTAKAAESANQAILDMADNAAKMGTPLESLQNAYQGFAKGNYTMLDNLKLGYGGTKAEMERLLADAQKLTGVEYNIDNLGDVYAAIHAIQGDLGLTGVAAEEAATTFSGSFGAMKASAENLMANLALGEDVGLAMEQLAQSAGTFLFDNLIPMIGNVISQIPTAVSTFMSAGLPSFMSAGQSMIDGIASGIQTAIPNMLTTVTQGFSNILDLITDNLPSLLTKGGEMLTTLVDGILENIPNIADAASQIVSKLGDFLSKNIPVIAEKGGELIGKLAASLIKNLPKIVVSLAKLALTMLDYFAKMVPTMMQAGVSLITGLAEGLRGSVAGAVESAMEYIGELISGPMEEAEEFVGGIVDNIAGFFPIDIGNIFGNLKLPHFSVSGGEFPWGIGGKGSMPSWSVSWYAKAMEEPYMFNRPRLIGVGEKGDEMVYGRKALMDDIREATGKGGQTVTINMTVNGADNPEMWATRFAREYKLQARTV